MAGTDGLEDRMAEAWTGDTCEAVVVGAGLAGAAVVAKLVAEGLGVAVLEAREVVGGASACVAGLVGAGLPAPYAQMAEEQGRETARALWELAVENRASLTSAADQLGVSLERSGSFALATEAEEADLLRTSAEMLSADGFEVRFEAEDPLERGFAGALYCSDDVVVDAAALARRLLEAHDVPLRTGAEVYGLEQDGEYIRVSARGYTVKASTVVLAVNGYAPLIDGYFTDKVAPVRGYALDTHPLEKRLISTPGSAGPFCFRQTHDGALLFTAWSSRYEAPVVSADDKSTELDLMRFVGRHFPEAKDRFARRKSGVMGISRDGLPLVGALPHLPQVFFAVGFAGHGLGLTFAAADLLTGLIVRGAEPALLSARRLESAR